MASLSNESKTRPTKAWATLLTKENQYIVGAKVLAYSLAQVKSKYPLVIVHTNAITRKTAEEFRQMGCILRLVEFLVPPDGVKGAFEAAFREAWSKIRVWELVEYERVVLLDADMLVVKNMDELMELELDNEEWLAASNACTCNPRKFANYPKSWVPESCAYTHPDEPDKQTYFNSGLVVLTPSAKTFSEILHEIKRLPDPSSLVFPNQDLLNLVFNGKWVPLPYIYNALKTVKKCHATMWHDDEVKNVHYILEKPWSIDMKDPNAKDDDAYPLYEWWWNMYDKMLEV